MNSNNSNLIIIKPDNKDQYYRTINLTSLLDKNLSFKAKGLHNYIMTRPVNWKLWMGNLFSISIDKESGVRAAINELIENNYLHRETIRDEKKRIRKWIYIACSTPIKRKNLDLNNLLLKYRDIENLDIENLDIENLDIENLDIENQAYSNKNNSNKNNSNKELYIDFLTKWNSCQIIIHKQLTAKIEASIKSILKDYSEQEIFKAFENYSFVIKSDKHYFNYKWTLSDFLKRGLEKFLDGSDPLNNFKDNNNQSAFKNPLPKTTQKLMEMDIWPKDHEFNEQRLARGLVELKEFADNLVRDRYDKCSQYYGTLALLLKEYTNWLYRQDWLEINENIIGTKNGVFKKFIEEEEKDIGIKIKSKGWG